MSRQVVIVGARSPGKQHVLRALREHGVDCVIHSDHNEGPPMRSMREILPYLSMALVAGAFGGSKDNGPDRKPTGRELRDPSDPHQRERIAAAARKRAMRAAKRAKPQ